MKRKAPCYKGGGRIKGEPEKPKQSTIDRNKYKDQLSKPISGDGTNIVSDRQDAFTPDVLKSMGYNYVSGTMGGRDIVYEKNGNYHLYNEQPDAAQNKFGLINIGNPYSVNTESDTQYVNPKESMLSNAPVVNTPRKSIDFSNPNLTLDPNTGGYKNPVTGAVINPIVENYSKGGRVKSKLVKGYALGGETDEPAPVVPKSNLTTNSLGTPISTTGTSPATGFAGAYSDANARNAANIQSQQELAKKQKNQANAKQAGRVAAKSLGAYGTTYYAANPGDSTEETVRSSALATLGQSGIIGGVIAGAAGIGDQIGAPIRKRSEAVDAEGNLIDRDAAKRNSIIGGILSPSKALTERSQYKDGFKDFSGNGYLDNIEAKAKEKIAADKAAEEELRRNKIYWQGKNAASEALIRRNEMDTSGIPSFANGGKVIGKGTAKSDSISAKVMPGSFVIPAENAPIIEEVKEKVLRKAPSSKKANLNQKGGVDVRLSNGEVLLPPEEKLELEMKGVDVEALAPDSDDNDLEFKDGGEVDTILNQLKKDQAKRDAAEKKAKQEYTNNIQREKDAARRVELQEKEAERIQKAARYDKLINREKDRIEKLYKEYESAPEQGSSTVKSKYKISNEIKAVSDSYNKYRGEKGELVNDESPSSIDNLGVNVSSKEKRGLDYFKGDGTDMSSDKVKPSDKANSVDAVESTTVVPTSAGKKAPSRSRSASVTAADVLPATSINQIPVEANNDNLYADRTPSEIARASQINMSPNENPDALAVKSVTVDPVTTNPAATTSGRSFDYGNALSSVLNYGLPLAQTAIGLKQLEKLGARPVDEIDPEYLSAIGKTRAGVTRAEENAKYGFTGAEQTAIDQQNNNLTNAGRYAARNFSGGSSSNALNMERSVINDSFGRSLNSKISDNALKLQKQQVAADRNAQLNEMLSHKQELNRRLFGDTLSGWNTDQSSAGGLLSAGLGNLISANKYDQFMKNYKATQIQ